MSGPIMRAGFNPSKSFKLSNALVPSPTWQNEGRGFVGPSQLHCASGCHRDTQEDPAHWSWGMCECVFTSKNPTGENSKCNDCRPCCVVLPRSAHPFLLPRSHREQVQSLLAQVLRWRLGVGKLGCLHGSGERCIGFELFLPESSPSGHWTSCWHPGPGSTTGVTLELEVPWHYHLTLSLGLLLHPLPSLGGPP